MNVLERIKYQEIQSWLLSLAAGQVSSSDGPAGDRAYESIIRVTCLLVAKLPRLGSAGDVFLWVGRCMCCWTDPVPFSRQKGHCPVFFLWRMYGEVGGRWWPNRRSHQVFSQVSKMTSLDCEHASTVIPSLSVSYLWMVSAHPSFPSLSMSYLWMVSTHPSVPSVKGLCPLPPMTPSLSSFFLFIVTSWFWLGQYADF